MTASQGLRTPEPRKPLTRWKTRHSTAFVLLGSLSLACGEQPAAHQGEELVDAVVENLAYSAWPSQAVVALDSFQIGADATVSGEVAVVRAVANGARSELSLLSGARILGNASADSIALAQASLVQGDAAFNALAGTGLITGAQVTPVEIPLPISVPTPPSVTQGPDNITIPSGGTRTLAQGNYNVIVINSSARLQLSGGLYQFRRITGAAQSRVECMAACEVRVLETAVFQANAVLGPAASASVALSDVQFIVLGTNTAFDQSPSVLQFAAQATVAGYLFVPNGTFRAAGAVAGKVVARDVLFTSGNLDGYNVPVIVESPESLTVRERQPVTFDVLARGHALAYQWLRNGEVIEGATGASYTIPALAMSDDSAQFSVRVSNRAGTVTSSPATLTVLPCESSDASCDGVDQDCSGEADEDYVPSSTRCGVGECAAAGTLSCVGGGERDDCTPGAPLESDATCDGKDEDCDGNVDEEYVATATACGLGACQATGETSCVDGAVRDSCQPGAPGPEDAACDGVDSDCDGGTDEAYAPATTECGVGACHRTGATACVTGRVLDGCTPGTPASDDTSCNGSDDDCDGAKDEEYVSIATTCGVGACRSSGATSCAGGAVLDSCREGAPTGTDDDCDGVDDDCDGAADESYAERPLICGIGACAAAGRTQCAGGVESERCTPSAPPAESDIACNGVDDDCDGAVDEDYVPVAIGCGIGACEAIGTTVCANGGVVEQCVPGTPSPSDASCDGTDNDCDGSTDEDYVALPTSCGVGACAATGVTSCAGGAVLDSCVAGSPAASDTTCNGADDDCDGAVDEDYPSAPTACGTGACGASGTMACVEGQEIDSCSPGSPGDADQVCNGIDDDCDGATDEDYVVRATTCGVGACRASGTVTCENGVVVTQCSAGAGVPSDVTCDGVDDDCDGSVDEDYEPLAIGCGIGACAAVGTTACVSGFVEELCEPGAPALGDAICNGVDEDCDGLADEDYVSLPTACGAGSCAAAGVTRCADGVVSDTCHPASPGASDDTCDGIDQDCDGVADEDYVPVASFCGNGVCRGSGQQLCEGGTLVDTCQPGAVAGDDADCNGLDEDCDGQPDDGFVAACQGSNVAICIDGTLRLTDCGDGDPCNGTESCDAGTCVPGMPTDIDDGLACTVDVCEPFVGPVHSPAPAGVPCGDGLVCSGDGACLGVPTVTQEMQALAVDVRYPISLRLGVRDGVMTYQFASWTGAGAVRSQPLTGTYSALRVPPVGIPWFSYSLQPLRIEIGNFSATVSPPSVQTLSRLNTLYVHVVAGRRGPGSIEVIPVGIGG